MSYNQNVTPAFGARFNPGGDLDSTGVTKHVGHTEDQSPRKSIWNTTTANDERFALAA